MNAGAYGSDWSEILVRALVVTADGRRLADARRARALVPALRASPRPGRRAGRIPARAAAGRRDQGDGRRADRAAEGDPADEQAHVRERLQESRRTSSARGGCSRRAGSRATAIGGAVISPEHANFIENAGGATTADALALMAEARRRAREQFGVELEHEVRAARAARAAGRCRKRRRGGETRLVAGGSESRARSRPRARAVAPPSRFRAAARAVASSLPGLLPPAARCSPAC